MLGQGRKLDERTRNRILILESQGVRTVDIARVCGVCERTVRRVRQNGDLTKSGESVPIRETQGTSPDVHQ